MVIDKGLYKFFYEKLLYTFAKNEFGEEAIDVRNVKIWDRTTSSGDKTSKKFVASKLLGDGAIKDQRYFYRLYNKFCNSGPLGVVDDLAFCKALEYLGCQIPEGISSRRLSDRAKALFNQFLLLNESDLQRREDIVEEIPSNYLAIVKHLITNEWWFCFRGHSQDKEEENL